MRRTATVWVALGCAILALPAPADTKDSVAGYIFGSPVPAHNYQFAKRIGELFTWLGHGEMAPEHREQAIWESIILNYEAFRRGIKVSEQALEERINAILRDNGQPFTRASDPSAYAQWARQMFGEDATAFESRVRFLLEIEQLKSEVRASLPASITEEELRQEFLNEKNHVGGEMVTFKTKEDAQAFYERFKDSAGWEAMKASGEHQVRPVGLMTLEAYMDLWSIPKEQIYAFHALEIGSVGPPMPFGTQEWCVYRLGDKRTGNLEDFPNERASYEQQLKQKKQYEALTHWLEGLKASANLKILPLSP